jgi:hypothetical protein
VLLHPRRPAGAPFYYLGRPASTWLEVLGAKRARRRRVAADTTERRAA